MWRDINPQTSRQPFLRAKMFEYIELFDNPKRKHTNNGTLSPLLTHALYVLPAIAGFEIRQQKLTKAGVQGTRGTSD